MRTIVQRVARAQVRVGGASIAATGVGLLLFVGVEQGDGPADADATARKVAALRVFAGRTPMDRTVAEVGGACLVVSQFTLAASLRRGNRPSFDRAAEPDVAETLYLRVAHALEAEGVPTSTGRFGATMEVDLVNDGPATFVVATRGGVLVE